MESSKNETVLEHVSESSDFTYRKVFRVDLEHDRCKILKSDPEGWQPEDGPISGQLAQFALNGSIHPEDVERFVTFTRLDHLRLAFDGGEKAASMIYRRRVGDDFQWNLMEVIPDRKEKRFVTLCVKDVNDVFREGVEREGLIAGSREILRNLEDRAYIISSLSSLFFSTYYVNLEQDTFRTVTQLGRIGDVLGDEANYTAALNIYANHFIHEEDRAEYLDCMSVQNLRNVLRWWQPPVVFEYRRLSGDPESGKEVWSWVRASMVLARTGRDDLPKTAVYMAQDISDSRLSHGAELELL